MEAVQRGEGRCCQRTATHSPLPRQRLRGTDGWEVGRGTRLMRGLKLGDLGQVPSLGLTLPTCSAGLLITIPEGVRESLETVLAKALRTVQLCPSGKDLETLCVDVAPWMQPQCFPGAASPSSSALTPRLPRVRGDKRSLSARQ